ncbi:MAG: hypothetical protein HC880_09390, partial [Bacteroidia bacterium]|nr:hypothetical protein [Bacteroidia bacterium]
DAALLASLHQKNVSCMLGTMWQIDKKALAEGPSVYQDLLQQQIDLLATDQPLRAAEACRQYGRASARQRKYLKGSY